MWRRFWIVPVVAFLAAGCQPEGGGTHLTYVKDKDGTLKVSFYSNKDTSVQGLDVNLANGKIGVQNMSGNASNLAPYQMQALITQSNNATLLGGQIVGLLGQALPLFGGQISNINGVPVVTAQYTEADRAAVLAKIDACPILAQNPTQRAALHASVASMPLAAMGYAKAIADALSAGPVMLTPR